MLLNQLNIAHLLCSYTLVHCFQRLFVLLAQNLQGEMSKQVRFYSKYLNSYTHYYVCKYNGKAMHILIVVWKICSQMLA